MATLIKRIAADVYTPRYLNLHVEAEYEPMDRIMKPGAGLGMVVWTGTDDLPMKP